MMDWDTITMANLQLTATEHRYYGDIFIYCCENADNEIVPVFKVVELFRSANLPRDVTMKILDICVGSKNPNHLGKKQFYAVLKLLAAHQAGLDICGDLLTTPLDVITLPRFTWLSSGDENERGGMDSTRGTKNRINLPESTTESESEAESPRGTGGSTDSPTPTNSVIHDRSDSILGSEIISDSISGGWQGLLVSEEQRQLLGTEEESSERHSSDEADAGDGSVFPPEEVWIISDEQREYYAAQFAQLQPDLEGLLVGSVARTFFEKSRLPVAELRRIWQLADVTRDGALSLQEFHVAMHLVVLRRNHVPLPDVLPPSLLALVVTQSVAPPLAVPVTTNNQKSPSNSVSASKEKTKEWTKFVDSPTGASGSLTSPGLQLVNFDFQKSAVERDPKILHPVPLRLTPEAAILASGANGNNCTTLGEDELLHSAANLVQRPLAKKPLPTSDEAVSVTPKKEPPPPPPPRPYRTHARSSSLDLNKLGKNGQNFLGAPPLIPPRISPGIISPRKLVCQKSEGDGHRGMDESQGFVADFSRFSPKGELVDDPLIESNNVPQNQQFSGYSGAFHLYKKQSPKQEDGKEADKEDMEEEKKMTLQELREKNAELRLICEELTRELASALQERINLRAKLLLLT